MMTKRSSEILVLAAALAAAGCFGLGRSTPSHEEEARAEQRGPMTLDEELARRQRYAKAAQERIGAANAEAELIRLEMEIAADR
jgi:hypothetical protein